MLVAEYTIYVLEHSQDGLINEYLLFINYSKYLYC